MKDKKILKYNIENDFLKIEILNLGAILRKLEVKDKNGEFKNIVISYDDIEKYRINPAYLGAVIGRTAGRIENSLLKLSKETFKVDANNNGNSLHGGQNSISHRFWDVVIKDKNTISCSIDSPHLDNGYPANIKIQVDYILRNNELEIKYFVKSDRETYVNLTNHSYFNLSANANETIYNDELMINADYMLKIDENSIPYEVFELNNSIFDFRNKHQLIDFFEAKDIQKDLANNGIDHPFILNKNSVKQIEISNKKNGIKMEIKTDNPSVVVYTANYFSDIGLPNHSAICFETQEVPNLYSNENLGIKPSFIDENKFYQSSTKFIFSIF